MNPIVFQNREEAARLLAHELLAYKGRNPLVLGIPRGAVPMAAIIARELEGELDVVLVHKLGAPGQPELAIGAVNEMGDLYLGDYVEELDIGADFIEKEREAQVSTLAQRRALYTPHRPPIEPEQRTVIVVDNGIATGATMISALRTLRRRSPKRLIAAAAVAPPETLEKLRVEADEVVCLETPSRFRAVGEFFQDFSEVTDERVASVLSHYGLASGAQ